MSGDLEPGQLVAAGRYRVVRAIGQGGMGAVYQAEQVGIHRSVALKTLLPGLGGIDDIARRFDREAKATSLLDHEAIVRVLDYGKLEDGTLYLAMEYVRGASLGELLEGGAIEPVRALTITRQVLEALAHAHTRGVIHRDLKPDNVMLRDLSDTAEAGDIVKLLDFGIARLVGDAEAQIGGPKLTQAGITFGTAEYMAPEQALGAPADGRADLYALGVILFEMLTGRKPIDSKDKVALLGMKIARDAPRLSEVAPERDLPRDLEALVAKALEKHANDRFKSAEAMLEALDIVLARLDSLWEKTTVATRALPSELGLDTDNALTPGPLAVTPAPATRTPAPPSPTPRNPGLSASDPPSNGPAPTSAPPSPTSAPLAAQAPPTVAYRVGRAHGRWLSPIELGAIAAAAIAIILVIAVLTNRSSGTAAKPGPSKPVPVAVRPDTRPAGGDDRPAVAGDPFDALALTLKGGKTCAARRAAIAPLRELGDKRAIAVLRRAAGLRSGFFGGGHPNSCLEKDAAAAIKVLQAD